MYNFTMDFEAFGSDEIEARRNLLTAVLTAKAEILAFETELSQSITNLLQAQTKL